MVSERGVSILNAAVREFIRNGDPVSSGTLYAKYKFGIRPASIRHELHHLTEDGYLDQPYHSSGRIPTDLGYEFYAEQALHGAYTVPAFAHKCASMFTHGAWDDLLNVISEELGVLGVVAPDADVVRKDGLESLVSHMDWRSPQNIQQIIRDFEELDARLLAFEEDAEEEIGVFVGKQSPITSSELLSVVMGEFGHRDKKVTLIAIGPKRMDYQKVIGTFMKIKNI